MGMSLYSYIGGNTQTHSLLEPLLLGMPVALKINDSKMVSKKRIREKILLIAPTEAYGLPGNGLVFSIPGYGCEMFPSYEIDVLILFRMGITIKTAKALKTELERLFIKQHNSKTQREYDNG